MSPITPAQDWKLHDIEVALRDAFPHFQNGEPITAAAIERIGNDISAGCIFPSRGPRGWREYAALEIVKQAVRDMRGISGEISGSTCEKMKKLFPEIKSGWDASTLSSNDPNSSNHRE